MDAVKSSFYLIFQQDMNDIHKEVLETTTDISSEGNFERNNKFAEKHTKSSRQ